MFHPQLIDHVKPALWALTPDLMRREPLELCAISAAGVAFMFHASGETAYERQWWNCVVHASKMPRRAGY